MRIEKYYYKLPIVKNNPPGDVVSNISEIYSDEEYTNIAGYMNDYYIHQTKKSNEWFPHFKTKVVNFADNKSVSFCYIANTKKQISAKILAKNNMKNLYAVKREIRYDTDDLCHGTLIFYSGK